MTTKLESAELFAKDRHRSQKYETKPYYTHLEAVVDTLKHIGVNDEDSLCAAWLHDTLEDTGTTFDDIEQRFGSNVAVMVLSLSKDPKLAKKERERQYIEQLKNAPSQALLIKLCDISSNLKELKNTSWSKTRKTKYVKKKLYNLNVIKSGLVKNKIDFPRIHGIVDGVNKVLLSYGQKPIIL